MRQSSAGKHSLTPLHNTQRMVRRRWEDGEQTKKAGKAEELGGGEVRAWISRSRENTRSRIKKIRSSRKAEEVGAGKAGAEKVEKRVEEH